jgi:ABC-2 type transport system ATP-binding protein
MTSVLEFDNIHRSYSAGPPVLAGVSFAMEQGEVLALLGRNGAGKSTLIRIAMGLLVPQEGRVRVFGLSPTADPVEVKRRIGYVSEEQVLPAAATIDEILSFHRMLFPRWDTRLEVQLLDRFRLPTGTKIRDLSKGQARQVALLCAISHRPELLILDEPAGGLDPATRREFLEASIQLLNREGSSILFSSHHMGDVERMGGRVILLDQGRVLLDDDLDHLREGVSVALIPFRAGLVERLEKMPGCLRVQQTGGEIHGIFRGESSATSHRLQEVSGEFPLRCSQVPLEELFVEMVGGRR